MMRGKLSLSFNNSIICLEIINLKNDDVFGKWINCPYDLEVSCVERSIKKCVERACQPKDFLFHKMLQVFVIFYGPKILSLPL